MGTDIARRTREILRLLERAYGKKRRSGPLPVLDHVLLCLLQESGPKTRARVAYNKLLKAFVGWNEVRVSSTLEIAEILEPVYRGKAAETADRVRTFLTELHNSQNRLSLDPLADLPPETSIELLEKLPALNQPARDCVLNQSLCNPDVPMSADVVRVAKRVGLVGPNLNYLKAREFFNERLKAADQLRLNLLFYQHAREVCTPKGYDCLSCVLNKRCDRGREKRAEARRMSANGNARKSGAVRERAAGSKAARRRTAPAKPGTAPSGSAPSKRAKGASSSKETQQVETTTLARKSAASQAAGKSSASKKKKPAKKAAKKKPAKKAAKKKPAAKKAAKKKPAKKAAKKKAAKKKPAKKKPAKKSTKKSTQKK